jgi:asparagine synthase (glutamine-hydrolysing)
MVVLTTRFTFIWRKYRKDLLLDLKRALYEAVSKISPDSRVAIAFSGGIDSSLLAKICYDLGKEVMLLTVGFPESHDIEFSKSIALKMGMQQKISIICYEDFQQKLHNIRQSIRCENISHIENCIAYLYIAKLARQNGLRLVLSANGCDELFCGYNGYRMVYNNGDTAIMKFMDEKIANEFALMQEITAVASQFDVFIKQPFLSEEFIIIAKTIPIDQKIKGPDDLTRKHVLRQVALSLGVPSESTMKPKKALQYGSLIHKYFKKSQAIHCNL